MTQWELTIRYTITADRQKQPRFQKEEKLALRRLRKWMKMRYLIAQTAQNGRIQVIR